MRKGVLPLIALPLLTALLAPSSGAVGAENQAGPVGKRETTAVSAFQARIADTSRQIQELLREAIPVEGGASRAFAYLRSFVQSYTAAVRRADTEAIETGLDAYMEKKVLPTLREYGLKDADLEKADRLLREWVAAELSQPAATPGK